MSFYLALQSNQYRLSPANTAATWAGTVGKRIMDSMALSTAVAPFAEDQIAKAMDLFHAEMQTRWTWKPTGASGAGGGLLDSSLMSGECAQLVSAFKALLCSPRPYGLGIATASVASQQWPTDESVLLFVVKHSGAVFGLHPNVLKPNWSGFDGGMRFQPLYAWGNHKVLKVDCGGKYRYFDPCYNNVYLEPEDMADWLLTSIVYTTINKQPVATHYSGRNSFAQPISFKAVGSATPEILKGTIKTQSGDWPVLIGPGA